jgi:hypothetical protein
MISSVASPLIDPTHADRPLQPGVRVAKANPAGDGTAPAPALGIPSNLADGKTLLAAQEQRPGGDKRGGQQELSDEEKEIVAELKRRDTEVRRHEQAHSSVAGSYGGLPSFEFERGPDGQLYAVGGEVKIDTRPLNDPEATIRKMDIVIRAALAPANPSAQDHAVAAQAKQARQQAIAEVRAEKRNEEEEAGEGLDAAGTAGGGAPSFAAASLRDALAAYGRAAGAASAPAVEIDQPPIEALIA